LAETLAERRAEFDAHVWNHVDDAFQKAFDSRRPLSDLEVNFVDELIDVLAAGKADDVLAGAIRSRLRTDLDLTFLLIQLVGLTRNKVVTDLSSVARAVGDNRSIPSQLVSFISIDKAWELAGPYLAAAARRAFKPLVEYDDRGGAIEALNQATWPGYIRQERAKRQGHEAEGRVAQILFALEIPFEPAGKADNPLTGDAQIKGVSFDIVIPAIDEPEVVVKSTVQTANIGQFGESKVDLEIQQAQKVLRKFFRRAKPVLVAFVDGVGFYSNTQGLQGALGGADEFAQFKTIWKIPVLASSRLSVPLGLALPDRARHEFFLDRYGKHVSVKKLTDQVREATAAASIEAGEALIVRP
jgi:hypothetical protein